MPSSPDNKNQDDLELEADSKAITEKSGSNLAFSFISLSPEKKQAMSSFYAFCRVADDIVDEKSIPADQRSRRIEAWKEEIQSCYAGTPSTTLGRELRRIIRRYLIPAESFLEILKGVEMDLTRNRYETFADLETYCYRVASAVGLVSIEIFEYDEQKAREYAVALGMAFQLTNILRDVGYDLKEYDRIYLPREELEQFGVREEDLLAKETTPARQRLLLLQYHRACHYFHKAARLFPHGSRKNFIAAEVMTEIYYGLLQKLYRHQFPIGTVPTRLNKFEKIRYLMRAYRNGASIYSEFQSPPKKVMVFGGGFAGMSAALHLSRDGHQVDLVEAKAYMGGRAHSFTDPRQGLHLDNGQHIFMGCYHHCLRLMDLLGVRDRLDCPDSMAVPYRNPDGSESILDAGRFPPPFHLLGALCTFGEVGWMDRVKMIGFAAAVRLGHRPRENETVVEWLQRRGQTPRSIRALWEPFCIAALNEPIERADASLFRQVLVQSLFGSREDSAIYIANVGLSEVLMPELARFLESTGGSVRTGTPVKALHFEGDTLKSATLGKDEECRADAYVSALPWKALKALLPSDDPLRGKLESIESSPILALHLLCDVEITPKWFVGFLDAKVDWVFNRTPQLRGTPHEGKFLYSVVISAAYPLEELSSSELERTVWDEIQTYFPHTRKGKIEHRVIYRSLDATFAARPQTASLRPGSRDKWSNLFLAGDWTDTGLPGTLEGAALSGVRAAQALR